MKRGALWFVVAADIALAALFTPIAISNFAHRGVSFSDVPATFDNLYLCLSTITPLLMLAAAFVLAKNLVRHQAHGQTTFLLHRFVFWTILLRAAARFVLSFFIPNESLHATVAFVSGAAFLFLAGLAFINYSTLQHQSWLEAEAAWFSKTTQNEPVRSS